MLTTSVMIRVIATLGWAILWFIYVLIPASAVLGLDKRLWVIVFLLVLTLSIFINPLIIIWGFHL